MYSERDHRQYVSIVLEFGEPTEAWYRSKSKTLRDAQNSIDWLVRQACREFMGHCRETFGKLSDVQALQRCKIDCPDVLRKGPEDHGELFIVREDDMAAPLGEGCLDMVGRRLARCLFAFGGWPLRFAALLGGEQAQRTVVADF